MKKPKKHKQGSPGAPRAAAPGEGTATASAPAAPAAPQLPREPGGEPRAARAAVPAVLFAILAALLFWGDMYIVNHGGELDARVYQPYQSFSQIEGLQPKDETEKIKDKGRIVYAQCAACHQNDGNGSTSQNAPPLAGSEWVLAKDPARLIRIVLHGLTGPIKVKDKEWGAASMVAWGPVLTDEQIAHVLTYVRGSWGNKAPAVTVEQVKKVREETKGWSGYMTAEELNKVSLKE